MSHKKHIDDLLRKNEGLHIISDWLNRCSSVLKSLTKDNLLSLSDTDKIKQQFNNKLLGQATIQRCNWTLDEEKKMFEHFTSLAYKCENIDVVLFSNVDDKLGALRTNSRDILLNAKELWTIVGEDFRFTTNNLAHGFCLGFEYYTISETYIPKGVYELACWGSFSIDVSDTI